jgi:circadian clock protein KaiB
MKVEASKIYRLKLYVAGQSPRSLTAVANLRKICEQHLPGRHKIEVIDLQRYPQKAAQHQILALPTLVRDLPEPVRKILGDLSDTKKALITLDLA